MSKNSYDFIMDIISKNNIKLSRSEQAIVKKIKKFRVRYLKSFYK